MFLMKLIKILCALEISKNIAYTNYIHFCWVHFKLVDRYIVTIYIVFIDEMGYRTVGPYITSSKFLCANEFALLLGIVWPYMYLMWHIPFYHILWIYEDWYICIPKGICSSYKLDYIWFDPNFRLKMTASTFHVCCRFWW
jgi:hypothetical protein